MHSLKGDMDLADFEDLVELIRNQLELLVEERYDGEGEISWNNKKMDALDSIEKLKRRVEMY
jgi:hypothetical protein